MGMQTAMEIRGARAPETEATADCEPLNSGSLQDQCAL